MNEKENHKKIRALTLFDSVTFAEKIWTRIPKGLLVSARQIRFPKHDPCGMGSNAFISADAGGADSSGTASVENNTLYFSSNIVEIALPDDYFDDYHADVAGSGENNER